MIGDYADSSNYNNELLYFNFVFYRLFVLCEKNKNIVKMQTV